MSPDLPVLIATSVVRGSQQGESHGGVYLVDFRRRNVRQCIDWNNCDIDFSGRGWDRGLRGIAFHDDRIYIAASDQLMAYDPAFNLLDSWTNRYLRHCHEIAVKDGMLFLSSTGFDSLLGFSLEREEFLWGVCLACNTGGEFAATGFDPRGDAGPGPRNTLHLNSVSVNDAGIFVGGLRVPALLRLGSRMQVGTLCSLPLGTHNAQRFGEGVLFNDTQADTVRYVERDGPERAFSIIAYDPAQLENTGIDDSNIARQRFGRGLCVVSEGLIAGGSSPSTISLYDLPTGQRVAAVNLSMDIRNAIHGLEVWPF